VFAQGVKPDYEQASNKIRDLIAQVTLRPSEECFKIELQGRLALLMGASNLYPNMRIAASGDRWWRRSATSQDPLWRALCSVIGGKLHETE